MLVNRSFITFLWWCRTTVTFPYRPTEKRTHHSSVSKTVVFSYNFNRYKIETLKNNNKTIILSIIHPVILLLNYFNVWTFYMYLLINQCMYGFVGEKTFEFLQVYKNKEFIKTIQKKTNFFNKSNCLYSHKTSSTIGMTSSILWDN